MHSEQEQLRHQYLEAIGVSSWMSCADLPGSAPSPDWVNSFQYPAPEIPSSSDRASDARAQLGLAKEGLSSEKPASHDNSQSTQSMTAAREALGLTAQPGLAPAAEPVATDVTVKPEDVAEENSVDDTSTQETPIFKLAFQRIGDVLIVDSLPPQGGTFSSNYAQLAEAIARSIGAQGDLGQTFMLPWPMFASKTLDQSREQAMIAVQHKLAKELGNSPVKAVLIFGQSAAQMVLNREEPLDELHGVVLTVKTGVKAVASNSLTEAMQLPGVKKQIWQDLQGLITELNNA